MAAHVRMVRRSDTEPETVQDLRSPRPSNSHCNANTTTNLRTKSASNAVRTGHWSRFFGGSKPTTGKFTCKNKGQNTTGKDANVLGGSWVEEEEEELEEEDTGGLAPLLTRLTLGGGGGDELDRSHSWETGAARTAFPKKLRLRTEAEGEDPLGFQDGCRGHRDFAWRLEVGSVGRTRVQEALLGYLGTCA